ncbi:MAG: glycosyltransferase [Pirellula sp.]|jgi:glycosyltransferase involved in cell wall biosynthesis
MRILFISDQFPYPLRDGGNLRTFHILAGLARHHQLTLVAHSSRTAPEISTLPLDCETVVVRKQGTACRVANALAQTNRLHGSLFLTKNWSSPLLRCASDELKRRRYDAIHFNHLDTAVFALARDWRQLKVFDTHNCLSSMAYQTAQSTLDWLRRRILSYEAKRLKSIETEICRQMDLSLVCSEVDAGMFRENCPSAQYGVVPNGVDTEFFRPEPLTIQGENSLVFTGAMNYFPNIKAVEFFCGQVLPKIATKGTKIHVVGRCPTSQIQALHDGQRVIVTGEVEDVRPFVHRSQIFVVPLQHGSGTRLKILEAFAMGKAVVSTSIGAEGIPATDGKELVIADSPSQMANAIDTLLQDPNRRSALGMAARAFVVKNFDWHAIQASVCDRYEQIHQSRTTNANGYTNGHH